MQLPHLNREQWMLAAGCLAVGGVCAAGWLAENGQPLLQSLRRAGRSARRVMGRSEPGIWIGGEFFSDAARVRHMDILGATGTGKSVFMEKLIQADIERGYGCLIIDPKGDRELYERVRFYAKEAGRAEDLHLLSATFPDESSIWNPCGVGNISELQSKFYNSAIYGEPHYAKWCEKGLLHAFQRLVPSKPSGFSILDVVGEFENFCNELKSKNDNIEGLFLDFYNLAYGEWGPLLGCAAKPVMPAKKEISLLEITKKNQILFVDLPTEAKKVQSTRIGRLITQEMMLISGLRKIHRSIRPAKPFSVYIDEFDAFATESFATFLNKARSSCFMITIAHQTLSDLNKVSPEFSGQILGNCNIRSIFRIDDPDDAERLSRFLGTRVTVKRTYQTQGGQNTGMSSNREVQEFIVPPDRIKTLPIGTAVFSIKTEGSVRIVRLKHQNSKQNVDLAEKGQPIEVRGLGEGSQSKSKADGEASLSSFIESEQQDRGHEAPVKEPAPQADPWSIFQPQQEKTK